MTNKNNSFLKAILNLPRFLKKGLAIIFDLNICILSTWFAFYLRTERPPSIEGNTLITFLVSICMALPLMWLFGLYKTIFRYSGFSNFYSIFIALSIYGFLYFLFFGVYGVAGIPRSIGMIQPLLLFLAILFSRFFLKYLFEDSYLLSKKYSDAKKILIYGAGNAGQQLVSTLKNNQELEVIGFVDDNEQLQGQALHGINIYSSLKINDLIKKKNIELVLLAIPSIARFERNRIIKNLSQYQLKVLTLPSILDIVNKKVTLSDIKDLDLDDILNRDEVKPDLELLTKSITSKVVLVTGAGGSIGSELSRQVIQLCPKKILLLEFNEFALYKIFEELKIINKNLEIIPLLVNVQNEIKVREIFKNFKVDTVYHAAAYKHVSLVEKNISESIYNNVFGTLAVAKAAILESVEVFVMISSDKAVRPTNVMGASKRLAEICVQALYHKMKNSKIKMSIVRFGNVIDSSGSVIPKFRNQIKNGGPITLTDPNVTRYFMTPCEASQLVIQAGAMGHNCDVFVLNMGEAVKIKELVYRMIKLSGLTIKDESNKEGDIEIKITGLEPGEKLYEELLLGVNPQKTQHPKIQRANDPFIPFNELEIDLNNLKNSLDYNKIFEIKNILTKTVKNYQSNSVIVDYFYLEKKSKFDKNSLNILDKSNKGM